MTIPSKIEQDIWSGKAVYRTKQYGAGGQTILPVGQNQYAIIFGYVFSPAGGGLLLTRAFGGPLPEGLTDLPANVAPFGTQQISFYTGDDYFPFVENVEIKSQIHSQGASDFQVCQVNNSPRARAVYIRANESVAISVGLIAESQRAVGGTIPVTQYTPALLTYGGSGQTQNVQTDMGSAPIQFLQPQVNGWDAAPYAYGLIPANASDQLWASPDPASGLIEPSSYIRTALGVQTEFATYDYYLTIHYALYNAAPDTKLQ